MDGSEIMEHYHYTECGLDNVFLKNGYAIHSTPYGEGVSINNLEELHKEIAKDICTSDAKIRGQEMRFLRSLLDLSQESLGRALGVERGTITRAESARNKDVSSQLDKSIRYFYLLHDAGVKEAVDLATLLRKLDDVQHEINTLKSAVEYSQTSKGWEQKAA